MLKTADFEIARNIAMQLDIPEEFGQDMDADEFYSDWLEDQVAHLSVGEFNIDNGASKAVIIFSDFNFVIKIPFNGGWYDQWDEENEEYSDPYFEPFHGAEAPDTSDYCWDECIRISDAYDAGFGELFPTTTFLCEHDGRRYYIQEKVTTARGSHPTPSENSRTRAKSMDHKYWYCNEDWRAMVIEMYGEDYLRCFIDWCKSTDNGILDDMHYGNFGFSMTGAPILLDVSGYRD